MTPPEKLARQQIDALLEQAGWVLQDFKDFNRYAAPGIAVREFRMAAGHGTSDYLLWVDGKVAGVVEAKPAGTALTGVEVQSAKYSTGLPSNIEAALRPLPFLYESTGVETRFTDVRDPDCRSRRVFSFCRPETLRTWLTRGAECQAAQLASTLRGRFRTFPPLDHPRLWPAQRNAVLGLEKSFGEQRPRALIQMATGSGKTFTAITATYRVLKHGGAQRVLFLVDRGNLARQAMKEFEAYQLPDVNRRFTEEYVVQRLTSNKVNATAKVVICTIQRLYAMLRDEEIAEEDDEQSAGAIESSRRDAVPVVYNPAIPPEFFDVMIVDECHRSIYTLWRQVLEYFDSFIVGLTATPAKHTYAFFNQNVVSEYTHTEAVADGVNVDFDVYKIQTEVTEEGARLDAGFQVGVRNRETRAKRWETLDDDLVYSAEALNRDVVAVDQIRTVIRAFRDRLFTEIFPGRTTAPKTLIFARDDSHADDIVQIVREEFGKGNDFARKITYKTTGVDPESLIAEFRTAPLPRIAVTVDMIATGTDIKPLEIVMFMRTVKSRVLFEQMKGRGVRVINPTDLQSVTADAKAKTRFVIVDCVGATEQPFSETSPLDRKKSESLASLLKAVSVAVPDEDTVLTLASRLVRLDRELTKDDREAVNAIAGGASLKAIAKGLLDACDPECVVAAARQAAGLASDQEPTQPQVAAAAKALREEAVKPLAANPKLRQHLLDLKSAKEQVIDEVTKDRVILAGFDAAAAERARTLVASFEKYLEEHRDEITALQVLYNRPYNGKLTYDAVRELADLIQAPPRSWTPDVLWEAYRVLDRNRVRGSGASILTNIVSLVRFAMHQESTLVPFPETAQERFENWIAQQSNRGRTFDAAQMRWLEEIRDHIAGSVEITPEDLDEVPFSQHGGRVGAYQEFGDQLVPILEELNRVLVA